jgi:hypothetical protein
MNVCPRLQLCCSLQVEALKRVNDCSRSSRKCGKKFKDWQNNYVERPMLIVRYMACELIERIILVMHEELREKVWADFH